MSRKTVVAVTLITVLIASCISAVVMCLLSGPMNWVAFVAWMIFFGSLHAWPVIQAARTGQLDACTAAVWRFLLRE